MSGQRASEEMVENFTAWPGVVPGGRRRGELGARRIESESDIDDVIALLRINYDRVVAGQREPVDAAA